MNPGSSPNESSQSLSILAEIDAACDQFEAERRAGSRPQIKPYLVRASKSARRRLLPELLRLEIAYRRQRGEVPRADDYQTFTPLLDPALLTSLLAPPPKVNPEPAVSPSLYNAPTVPFEGGSIPAESTLPDKGKAATPGSARRLFGDYELLKKLGQGGMGVVYLARQRSADRLVALKLVRLDRLEHLTSKQRQDWLDRFRTEGQATARVADERVVTVYEVGALNGRPFYSMRYVKGRNLAEILEEGPLPNRRAAALMEQVARAVQAVHEEGVLHRDLKPHNVLVDAQGRPYVTDFGLAKWLDAADGVTHTGDVLGSPPYVSPEQAQDAAHVSEATDVYGLGATLYALLTGRPPFQGKTVAETLHQVKYREPTAPRRLNPTVNRDLETIALKCLEKEPARRFGSAAEVANELKRHLEGRPVRTRPIGLTGRLWRWSRRNRIVASLAAAAVVLMALTGGLYWGFWSRGKEMGEVEEERTRIATSKKAIEYLEAMHRAQKHVDGTEFTKAREVLAQWEPREGEPKYRGWEWYFLKAQCREAPFTVRGHQGSVQAVAWSPDSTRLASADQQGIVKIWDVAASTEVQSLRAEDGNLTALAWSSDGKLLAAAGAKAVQIWEVDSGRLSHVLQQAANVHPPAAMPPPPNATPEEAAAANARQLFRSSSPTTSFIWSPSSPKLALADTDGKIQVWDLSTPKKDPLVIRAHEGGVHSVAWNPNGNRLASISSDVVIKIWDTASDKPIFTSKPVLPVSNFPFPMRYALAWTADGKRLNVVSEDAWLGSMDVASGTVAKPDKLEAYDPMLRHGLTGMARWWFTWSPDGKALATVSSTGLISSVSIWDVATRKEGPPIPKAGVAPVMPLMGAGCSPAWDPNSRRLALGWGDGTIQTVRAGANREAVRSPRGALAWSRDSKHLWGGPDLLAAAAEASEARRIQAQERFEDLQKSLQRGMNAPPDLNLHFRGGGIIDQRPKHQIQVSDAVTGAVMRKFGKGDAPGASLPIALAESPDGKWLASATSAGSLQLWAAAGGDQAVTLDEPGARPGPGGRILLAWNPRGNQLAATSLRDHAIRLWDPDTRQAVKTLNGHEKPLRSLVWSADGKRLASADDGGTVRVWDAAADKETLPFTYYVKRGSGSAQSRSAAPSILSWCPDGTRLAVAAEDELVHVWDVDTGKELALLHGHPPTVDFHEVFGAVAWSPDGKRLASVSPDRTFLLWDTATWKEILALRLPGQSGRRSELLPGFSGTLAWSPDGWQLAFFGSGIGAIWDATPEEEKERP
jgi:WD40 repeat protein/serine/threonine protein kinase